MKSKGAIKLFAIALAVVCLFQLSFTWFTYSAEQQAKEFQEEVCRRSDEARQQLGKQIDSQIDHAFIQMGLLKAEARKTTESISDGLQRLIDERITDALNRLGIAKAEDISALTSRIELLEQKIAKHS